MSFDSICIAVYCTENELLQCEDIIETDYVHPENIMNIWMLMLEAKLIYSLCHGSPWIANYWDKCTVDDYYPHTIKTNFRHSNYQMKTILHQPGSFFHF